MDGKTLVTWDRIRLLSRIQDRPSVFSRDKKIHVSKRRGKTSKAGIIAWNCLGLKSLMGTGRHNQVTWPPYPNLRVFSIKVWRCAGKYIPLNLFIVFMWLREFKGSLSHDCLKHIQANSVTSSFLELGAPRLKAWVIWGGRAGGRTFLNPSVLTHLEPYFVSCNNIWIGLAYPLLVLVFHPPAIPIALVLHVSLGGSESGKKIRPWTHQSCPLTLKTPRLQILLEV